MGDKSEILDSLSKLSTGMILALILGFQIWNNSENDEQWNERLAGLIERNAASLERQADNTEALADALVRILEERND